MATTIPEPVTTILAGTLRLLLTSISYRAKPEKRYGGSRQWFRAARRAPAARLPRRVEGARLTRCALTADRCQIANRRAGMVCGMLHCLAWTHNRGAPLRPYIHYYNRRYALTCTASGVAVVSGMCWRFCGAVMCSNVAQAAQYSRMQPPHNSSKNTANSRKSVCKALCAVLQRWRYNCIDKTKRSVSACIGLYFSRAKQKPCTLSRCKAKEKPGHF